MPKQFNLSDGPFRLDLGVEWVEYFLIATPSLVRISAQALWNEHGQT